MWVSQGVQLYWLDGLLLFSVAGAVDLYTSAPTTLVLVAVLAMAIYT